MTRYVVRLVVIAVLIAGTPATILLLGYSGTAATLGAILAAALTWVPTLLALEGLHRASRPDLWPPVRGGQRG